MTSKKLSKTSVERVDASNRLQAILFWACVCLLAMIPLAFTTAVYRAFTLPKFAILLIGSAVILLMLALVSAGNRSSTAFSALKSKQVALVALYIIAMAVSTLFGEAPIASLFGSYPNQMGLITRVCFFVCFIGLIVGAGKSCERFIATAWTISFTGLIVAAYAFAQIFGRDPFLPQSAYTLNSPAGPVLRVIGTLGHSNYLGNFLLYTTPVAAALVVCSRGRARRLAIATVALSIAAIIFSGTRGAWVGLAAGAVAFAFFELRRSDAKSEKPAQEKKRARIRAAVAAAVVLIAAIVIILSPVSRNVALRARSFASDRFTGAGRVLLWSDAVRMIPAYWLTGCGPEAFGKAFLAYKSKQLAIHAPQINNESSHNSYLDAAITFGLPGAALYIAITVMAFRLLLTARRRATDRQARLIITGLFSSLAAVVVHNFFIYDQIPTGLYFFAFMALAVIASNATAASASVAEESRAQTQRPSPAMQWAMRAAAVAAFALVVAAAWFSISVAISDRAIKQAFAQVEAKDFNGLVASGERAAQGANPTGHYNFLFARALALYANALLIDENAGSNQSNGASINAQRARAIEMATAHAEKSLAHTLSPEANYMLLAHLAFAAGDAEKLREMASEAIRWDPNYYRARWLMAEALLAAGDRDGAEREARLALELRRSNSEATSVLARIRGERVTVRPRVQGLIERARLLSEKGNTEKAKRRLDTAIRVARGPCPDCHRELALLYEKENRYKEAIAEWEAFARESPEGDAAEQAIERIKALRQK